MEIFSSNVSSLSLSPSISTSTIPKNTTNESNDVHTPNQLKDQSKPHNTDSPYQHYFLQQSPSVEQIELYTPKKKIDFILRKTERTLNDAIVLYKQLKFFQFFKNFKHQNSNIRVIEALIHLSRVIRYEYHPPRSILFSKGDISNKKIYLIYSGEVATWNSELSPFTEIESNHVPYDQGLATSYDIISKSAETTPRLISQIDDQEHTPKTSNNEQNLLEIHNQPKIIKLIPVPNDNNCVEENEQNVYTDDFISSRDDLKCSQIQKRSLAEPIKARSLERLDLDFRMSPLNLIDTIKGSSTTVHGLRSPLKCNKKIVKSLFQSRLGITTRRNSSSKDTVVNQDQNQEKTNEGEASPKIMRRVLMKGRNFGEKVLEYEQYRGETAMTLTDCEILSFTQDDYKYLMLQYHNKNSSLTSFLLDCIPGLEKVSMQKRFENLITHFEEEIFHIHSLIISEKRKGKTIFLLYKGFCELVKDIELSIPIDSKLGLQRKPHTPSNRAIICVLRPGLFIGEEILFNECQEYEQTIKASSAKTKVLKIDAEKFKSLMTDDIINELKRLWLQKKAQNNSLLSEKVKKVSRHMREDSIKLLQNVQNYHSKRNNVEFSSIERHSIPNNIDSSNKIVQINSNARRNCEVNAKLSEKDLVISDGLAKFENSLHQNWRGFSVKNYSRNHNDQTIRSGNEKLIFRNKPYFKKLVEEKFLQVRSPLTKAFEFNSPVKKESPKITPIGIADKIKPNFRSNRHNFTFGNKKLDKFLNFISPKNGRMLAKSHTDNISISLKTTRTNNFNITTVQNNDQYKGSNQNKHTNIRDNEVKDEIQIDMEPSQAGRRKNHSLEKYSLAITERFHQSSSLSSRNNSQPYQNYAIFNLPCFGNANNKHKKKNLKSFL